MSRSSKNTPAAKTASGRPVLSIVVRRFGAEDEAGIMGALTALQRAAARQPGYLGDHNSLARTAQGCELVNVFAFESHDHLAAWEQCDIRRRHLADLDRLPQQATSHTRLDALTELLNPPSRLRKIEIVVILIFWILLLGSLLGWIADHLLPTALPLAWRSALLVAVNVVLISYLFLPWSGSLVTRLKRWMREFSRRG